MPQCKAFGCRNVEGKCGKSFFRFPNPAESKENQILCRMWISNLKNTRIDINRYMWRRGHAVCEDHFAPDCIVKEFFSHPVAASLNFKPGRKRLVKGAVPTLIETICAKKNRTAVRRAMTIIRKRLGQARKKKSEQLDEGHPAEQNPDPVHAGTIASRKRKFPLGRSKPSKTGGLQANMHFVGEHLTDPNPGFSAAKKRKVPFQSKLPKSKRAGTQPSSVAYPEDWQAVQDSEICLGYQAAHSALTDCYSDTSHNTKMEKTAALPPTTLHTMIQIKSEPLDTSYETLPEDVHQPITEAHSDVPRGSSACTRKEPSNSPVETITMPEWGIRQTCEIEKCTLTDCSSDSVAVLASMQAFSTEDHSSSDPPRALHMFINSAYLESCLKSENPGVKCVSTDLSSKHYTESELPLSMSSETLRNPVRQKRIKKNRPSEKRTEIQCLSPSSKE